MDLLETGKHFQKHNKKKKKKVQRMSFEQNNVNLKQIKSKKKFLKKNKKLTTTAVDTHIINQKRSQNRRVLTHQTLFLSKASRKPKKKKVKKLEQPDLKKEKPNLINKQFKIKEMAKNLVKQNANLQDKFKEIDNVSNKKLRFKNKLKSALESNVRIKDQHNLKKKNTVLSLRERMLEKLKSARFRYLNEQMYTSKGQEAKQFFEKDKDAFIAYHNGYQQQVAQWPVNPVDVIIEKIKKLPQTHIIADFGCGEAKLSKSIPHKVYSFDLVAINDEVQVCDMAHVPLTDSSIDVVVFCLSLMGVNLKDYLIEAYRVLKPRGLLKIAEVESRFEDVSGFIKNLQIFGFSLKAKDYSHQLFCFLDFTKKEPHMKPGKLPEITLNPCLYKKR